MSELRGPNPARTTQSVTPQHAQVEDFASSMGIVVKSDFIDPNKVPPVEGYLVGGLAFCFVLLFVYFPPGCFFSFLLFL